MKKEKVHYVETFDNKHTWIIALSILLFSMSMLSFQVVLTKIFSAVLFYNYAFLVISGAIFGLGIGSLGVYYFAKNFKNEKSVYKALFIVSFILSMSFLIVSLVLFKVEYINNLIFYLLMSSIPFVLGGIYLSLIFKYSPNKNYKIYFADLIGSAVGSVAVVAALNSFGVFQTIIIVSMIAVLSGTILIMLANKKVGIILTLIPLAVLLSLNRFNFVFRQIDNSLVSMLTNSDKTFGGAKQFNPKLEYTKWDAFSRTDVIGFSGQNEKVVTIDGGANAPMQKFDGDFNTIQGLKNDIGYLPYYIGKNDNTLIIGPGGGIDILYSLLGGSKRIDVVEQNKSTIDAGQFFKNFNGNIFNRPEVKTYNQDGRAFVENSKDYYNTIFLSVVMAQTQTSGYAFSESYIYTQEAIENYYNHLSKNGKLALKVHDEEDLTKIIATVLKMLESKGITPKDAIKYMAIFNMNTSEHGQHGGNSIHQPLVLVKNQPFTQSESMILDKVSKNSGNQVIFLPYVMEEGIIGDISKGTLNTDEFISKFPYYAEPATDDSPFFYNYNKGISIYLITPIILVLLLGFFIFMPITAYYEMWRETSYFSLLGLGFMLIEIPLIQKFTLFLGHPVLSFSFVVTGLLLGAGIGSLLSKVKYLYLNTYNRYLSTLIVGLLTLISNDVFADINKYAGAFNFNLKILITLIFTMILGLFMGMPFPFALDSISNNKGNHIIPFMLAVNGAMSILGSTLAVIIAMKLGISYSLYFGALVYIIVFLVFTPRKFGKTIFQK